MCSSAHCLAAVAAHQRDRAYKRLRQAVIPLNAVANFLKAECVQAAVIGGGMPASSQARRKPLHFLPVVASAVTVGVTWQLVLHSNIGIFTYWLKLIGVSDPNLLNNTVTAIYAVVFVDIWKTLITVLLLSINNCWNDLLWPMIVASKSSMRTLSNGLAIFIGNRTDNYCSAFTDATVSMMPLLIL